MTADGRVEVELRSWSAYTLASEVVLFGARVEVVQPVAVREELAGLGADLTRVYGRPR